MRESEAREARGPADARCCLRGSLVLVGVVRLRLASLVRLFVDSCDEGRGCRVFPGELVVLVAVYPSEGQGGE